MGFSHDQLKKANIIDATVQAEAEAAAIAQALPNGTSAVKQGATVAVRNSAGADSHNATAVVSGKTLTGVNLAATVAMVDNGDSINVENSAGNLDSPAVATVAAGAVTNVRLAATKTIVTTAQALTGVAPTGTYTNTVTFTVANGLITGIALS